MRRPVWAALRDRAKEFWGQLLLGDFGVNLAMLSGFPAVLDNPCGKSDQPNASSPSNEPVPSERI